MKILYHEKDVREKIISAVNKICQPVIETIGPKGKKVLFETSSGNYELTEDGITIVRAIEMEDPVENAVVDLVKDGSLRTNLEAGDATSTTVLFISVLFKKAMQLKEDGFSHTQIQEMFENVLAKLVRRLEKIKKEVVDDKTKLHIATISADGDLEVAENVTNTVKTAGVTGMVYLELNPNEKTVLEKEEGFRIAEGMKFQNLYNDVARPMMVYRNIPVLILDKTLYYAEESEEIIRKAVELGFKEVCIVAKDFLGDAPNTLIANHVGKTITIALAKLGEDIAMDDLAVYLGGNIVSESTGRRIDSIDKDDFVIAKSVTADPQKILFTNIESSKGLKERVKYLKGELDKNKEDKAVKARLASLTNGIVTIKVGGRTEREAREKVYRYEDAINALRAAMTDGYLIGGGLSMYNSFDTSGMDYASDTEREIAQLLSNASIIQIAKNAQHNSISWEKMTKTHGYNARTNKYENLLESGVVEPFKATEMALRNAVSVSVILTSIGTFILNKPEEETKQK